MLRNVTRQILGPARVIPGNTREDAPFVKLFPGRLWRLSPKRPGIYAEVTVRAHGLDDHGRELSRRRCYAGRALAGGAKPRARLRRGYASSARLRVSRPTEPMLRARVWKAFSSKPGRDSSSARICSQSRWPTLYDGAWPGQPR